MCRIIDDIRMGRKPMRRRAATRRGGFIGVISDTHGLLRPEALVALDGAELIVHAGDVGSQAVLDELGRLAPVVAVRGNNDRGAWVDALPETTAITIAGARVYVIHEVKRLRIDSANEGLAAVVFGHSHRPGVERLEGVLFLNPGSAGPRRFSLPVTVARLYLRSGAVDAEIVPLDLAP
jgi:putative phosphoesterase